MIQFPSSSLGMCALEFSHQAVRKHKESYEEAHVSVSAKRPFEGPKQKPPLNTGLVKNKLQMIPAHIFQAPPYD